MIKDYGISYIDLIYNNHIVSDKINPVWILPSEHHLDNFLLRVHQQVDRMGEALKKEIAAQAKAD